MPYPLDLSTPYTIQRDLMALCGAMRRRDKPTTTQQLELIKPYLSPTTRCTLDDVVTIMRRDAGLAVQILVEQGCTLCDAVRYVHAKRAAQRVDILI